MRRIQRRAEPCQAINDVPQPWVCFSSVERFAVEAYCWRKMARQYGLWAEIELLQCSGGEWGHSHRVEQDSDPTETYRRRRRR
jgi:hypothetical protein